MSQNRQVSHAVAEIFTDVGRAFTLLGEVELMVNSDGNSRYKVTESDLRALRACVSKFTEDINKICIRIKDRTLLQIRNSMKRHAYEEAGLPMRKTQVVTTPKPTPTQEKIQSVMSQTPASKSADITLNMLNATEQEVDVEGLSAADKLDYDSADN